MSLLKSAYFCGKRSIKPCKKKAAAILSTTSFSLLFGSHQHQLSDVSPLWLNNAHLENRSGNRYVSQVRLQRPEPLLFFGYLPRPYFGEAAHNCPNIILINQGLNISKHIRPVNNIRLWLCG